MTDPIFRTDTSPTCTLGYIRQQLGQTAYDYSDRRMVTYVTQLIEQRGFPKPFPTMVRRKLIDAVTPRSRWVRVAVDTWLFDFLPPEAAGALDRAAHRAAAHEMDQAAMNLGRFDLRAPLRLVGGTAA